MPNKTAHADKLEKEINMEINEKAEKRKVLRLLGDLSRPFNIKRADLFKMLEKQPAELMTELLNKQVIPGHEESKEELIAKIIIIQRRNYAKLKQKLNMINS